MKLKAIFFVFGIICLIITGCATQFEISKRGKVFYANENTSFYISCANLGIYNNRIYENSAEKIVYMTKYSFSKYFKNVTANIYIETLDEAIAEARNVKSDYLIYIEILHWEDRATEWSGIRDKASIKLSIYSSNSKEMVGKYVIYGEGTYWTLGGYKPQDIFVDALDQLAKQLENKK